MTLRQWLKQGTASLIDVREPAEYRARHIAQATLIPLNKLDSAHLPNGPRNIVVHCLKGGRGSAACDRLAKRHPKLHVYNLEGGIDAWANAGLPVVRGGFALPLDRQVQLSVGLLLIVCSILTLFVNPYFVVLVAIMGTGLTVAGATGFCGLARLLARAPWNK